LDSRYDATKMVIFGQRSAAYFKVREHRSAEKCHLQAVRV
jgi:hypothetical protein